MRNVLFIILLFAIVPASQGQSFSRADVKEAIATMDDSSKVSYINKNFYTIYSSDFHLAKELTSQAIKISNANQWQTRKAYSLMNFGIVTYLKGEYEESLPAYLQSHELFDSLQDFSGLAFISIEMANYYSKNGHLEKKYALLDSAEKWSFQSKNEFTLAKSYGMRAAFLYQDGFIDQAKVYYQKNYESYKKMNHKVGLGYVLLDLAKYAQREGDIEQALAYVAESSTIRTQLHDNQGIAENKLLLGDLMLLEKNYTAAINYYRESIKYATEIAYPDLVRKAYSGMSDASKLSGNFQNAFYYLDSAHYLKDSLFNISRTQTIEDLQTSYETAKKEQQIEVQQARLSEQQALINQNRIMISGLLILTLLIIVIAVLLRNRMKKQQLLTIKKKELEFKESQLHAIISSQELERKRFATDLHDGFGQLITVLKMNVSAIKNKFNVIDHELFEKSTELLDGMYDELRGICFNLMPHTLVEKGLVSALKEFVNRINLSGEVKMELLVFDFDDRLEDLIEISVYRITQEWVNNILKYNSPNLITVQITRDDEEFTLTIEDNGIGFDVEKLINGKGNGWKNMSSRANLVKGVLDIDSNPDQNGSLLILNIPMK